MNIEIINNINEIKKIEKGSFITIIKNGDARIYNFISVCPLNSCQVIFSNPNKGFQNNLFRFTFPSNKYEIWILGNVIESQKDFVDIQRVVQLRTRIQSLESILEHSKSKKIQLIKNSQELKKIKRDEVITILNCGKVKRICYLTFFEQSKIFLFYKYNILQVGSFLDGPILSGDQNKIYIKHNYDIYNCSTSYDMRNNTYFDQEMYCPYLNRIVIKGTIYNIHTGEEYLTHNTEVTKMQLFQIKSLMNNILGLEPYSMKKYFQLLKDIEND